MPPVPTSNPASRAAVSKNRSPRWPLRLAVATGVTVAYFALMARRKEVPGVVDEQGIRHAKYEHAVAGAPKVALEQDIDREMEQQRRANGGSQRK